MWCKLIFCILNHFCSYLCGAANLYSAFHQIIALMITAATFHKNRFMQMYTFRFLGYFCSRILQIHIVIFGKCDGNFLRQFNLKSILVIFCSWSFPICATYLYDANICQSLKHSTGNNSFFNNIPYCLYHYFILLCRYIIIVHLLHIFGSR